MNKDYIEVNSYLEANAEEVNGYDFYRFIFSDCENAGEFNTDYSKPNAIYLYKDEKDAGSERRLRRRIMLNDTWEDDYMEYVEQNTKTLCSGLTYRGRANTINNAQRMNALIFDLDGVGLAEIQTLFFRFDKDSTIVRTLPTPTFVVSSGTGLHIYYVFDKPIDLYPNIKLQMKQLKYDLTFRIWEYKATSKNKQIQKHSISQNFRMVGSINEKYGAEIKAYKVGDKVSLEYINKYIYEEKNRVDITKPFKPTQKTLLEAKDAYPEWYQRVVVEGNKKLKKWNIKDKVNGSDPFALYHWWMNQWYKIRGGHRYFFLMCMVIYACKCDVPKKKLKKDLQIVFENLKNTEHTNALTQDDIDSALETYSKEYYNFTIHDIEELTDVRIERNKRNGRKQEQHMKRITLLRDNDYPNGEWRNKDGRPSAEQEMVDYLIENPTARKVDVINGTGLSKPTVYKHYSNALEKAREEIKKNELRKQSELELKELFKYASSLEEYCASLKG